MIVGLTGGIGSGKTYVASCFNELGVPTYNSDLSARKIVNENPQIITAIKAVFGATIYNKDGLDRAALSKIVFSNRRLLEQLNAIVHPAVKVHFENWYNQQKSPFVIKESAILIENGGAEHCDKIILVTAPIELRKQRVHKRDDMPASEFLKRVNNQWEDQKKIPFSDFIIDNIERQQTKLEVERIYHQLLK